MGEWELISVEGEEGYLSKASWERIAEKIGGEAHYASEYFTSVSGIQGSPNLSKLGMYVAPDAAYGMITYNGWSGGGPDTWNYFLLLDTPTPTALSCGSGVSARYNTIRVFVGEDFSVISNLNNIDSPRSSIFEKFHDVLNNRDFIGMVDGNYIFDLCYPHPELTGTWRYFSRMINGANMTQADGSLYCELVKLMGYGTDSSSRLANVIVAENIYQRYVDYAQTERVLLINGVKFSSLLDDENFFPTE
jgi:hypothetical protein